MAIAPLNKKSNYKHLTANTSSSANPAKATPLQAQADQSAAVTDLSILQRQATAATLQRMKWPKKKSRPDVEGTGWEDYARELWEWCDLEEQFYFFVHKGDLRDWLELKDTIKSDTHWDDFTSSNDDGKLGLIAYLKSKAAPPPIPFARYDTGSYEGPSDVVIDALRDAGLTIEDFNNPTFATQKATVTEHDITYTKERWEKENNPGLTRDERTEFNARAATAAEQIIGAVVILKAEKKRIDDEAERVRVRDAKIQTVIGLAGPIAGFVAVQANPLARTIWEASVANAGRTGYLEVGGVHPKATVTAATALLRTFSTNWTASATTDGAFMQNPHCPGGGQPQDKSGHASEDARGSPFQADFIADWGGSRTVIHINSDSL